jgi:hypothetical protein
MSDLTATHAVRRHVGHAIDGSDAISFVLYNTEHYMPVDKAQALADAIHGAIGEQSDEASLAEHVTRPAIHETTWSDDQQMVLWHMLKYIDQGNRELAERVRVLESLNCLCRDCVMHRDKARHGRAKGNPGLPYGDSAHADNGLAKGACMTHVPSEGAPAWQRAKVGDRVQHRTKGMMTVHAVDDTRLDSRLRCGPYFVNNENVLAILPPEPAAPVQDVFGKARAIIWDGCGGDYATALKIAETLDAAGLLAGQPQRVTRERLRVAAALYRDHNGDPVDKLAAALRSVGIDVGGK